MNRFNKNSIISFLITISFLASSLAVAQTQVYRTESNSSAPPELQAYDIGTDSWSTLANLPASNTTQLATSDTDLFTLTEDGNIYVYNVAGDSWDFLMAGPAAAVGHHAISMFETHNNEFYWADDGTSTLHYTVGGVWTSAATPFSPSSAADFDRINGVLYIRTYSQLGHFSFDPGTGTFANGCPDATGVGENSRAGSFYAGAFYTRTYSGNLIATDVSTCSQVDTGVALTTEHSSSAADDNGNIYLNGYSATENTFEVLNVNSGILTALADSPDLSVSGGHPTLAIVRNGSTIPSVDAIPVPTLGQWSMALMILLLSVFAGRRLQAGKPE